MPQKPDREYRNMEMLTVKADGRRIESDLSLIHISERMAFYVNRY